MREREDVKASIDEPVTDAEVAQLRVLLADESMHQTPEDASWCNVLSRLLARIEQDAAAISQLTKERDAAFAGGEELSAALRMANAEVARLRDGIAFIIQIIGHLRWCQTCAEDGNGECFNYGTLVADLIANHPAIAREMGVTNE